MLAHVGAYGGTQCERRLVTRKALFLQGVHQTVTLAWVGRVLRAEHAEPQERALQLGAVCHGGLLPPARWPGRTGAGVPLHPVWCCVTIWMEPLAFGVLQHGEL